ncbi:MAG: hypothetical protein JWR39_950, partial [Devosia sp.]|nr:hypothetical protein [Devosia sp.]
MTITSQAAPDEGSPIDLRAILGLLRRQVRLILVTALLVAGLAALVSLALKPVYTAAALVLV